MLDGHLHQLAPDHGVLLDQVAEGRALAREAETLVEGAPREGERGHRVVDPAQVEHLGHVGEAAAHLADRERAGPIERDLAARHGARAQLVLEAVDPEAIGRAVHPGLGHQEEPKAPGAGRRPLGPRQHHHDACFARVAAEPLVAVELPVVPHLPRGGEVRPHVRAALLLGEEHGPLQEGLGVARGQPRQVARLERGVPEGRDQPCGPLGHADGAVEALLGLREDVAEAEGQRMRELARIAHRRVVVHAAEPRPVRQARHLLVARVALDLVDALSPGIVGLEGRRVLVGQFGERGNDLGGHAPHLSEPCQAPVLLMSGQPSPHQAVEGTVRREEIALGGLRGEELGIDVHPEPPEARGPRRVWGVGQRRSRGLARSYWGGQGASWPRACAACRGQ
ncbi:hypothetical protein D3C86_1105640 [compost metagenome]